MRKEWGRNGWHIANSFMKQSKRELACTGKTEELVPKLNGIIY
jgi:hypothetical protein